MSNFGNWQQDLSSSFPPPPPPPPILLSNIYFLILPQLKIFLAARDFYFTVLYSDPAAPYDREMPDLNLGLCSEECCATNYSVYRKKVTATCTRCTVQYIFLYNPRKKLSCCINITFLAIFFFPILQ